MRQFNVRAVLAATTILSSFSIGAVAAAQAGGESAADDAKPRVTANGGEIVVTATRREERLRDVPVAVSAFTDDDIARRNAASLDELQAAIPGIRLVDIGAGSQRIQMRGVSQYLGLPTVGNYLDEISLSNFSPEGALEVQLIDLERIEVLRGPQPVLYGEGSMGGTIRYITADPVLNEYGGNFQGQLSSVKDGELGYRVEGAVNIPLIEDKAAFRLAAAQRRVGGWIDGPLGEDVNDRDITTIRGKLLLRPTDRLEVSFMGLFNDSRQDSISFSLDGVSTAQTYITPQQQKYALGTAEITYDFGPLTLQSNTGYFSLDGKNVRDTSAFNNVLFAAFSIPATLDLTENVSMREQTKFSQEIRLTSNGDGPLKYIFGGSYTNSDISGVTTILNTPGPVPFFSDDLLIEGQNDFEVWAGFGNVSYDLTEWLTIEAGGRYFSDSRTTLSLQTNLNGGPPGVAGAPLGGSATFTTFNPRAGVTIKTGDSGILYLNAARGFRSGGFNVAPGAPNPTFDPESLWTYELGGKQSFFDNRLFAEVAFYYQDYNDIQSTNVTLTAQTAVFNAGKASGPGIDVILQAAPSDDLSLGMSLGWSHIRFDTTSVDKIAGDPLDLVPDLNFSASFDYTPMINGELQLIAHADVNYTSEAEIILRQIGALGFDTITPNEARTIVNLRVGLARGGVEGFIFAQNIGNQLKEVNPDFGAFVEPIFTQPRTIGIGARVSF